MLQVMDIRQQANQALQQAQTEITEAEQAAAEAQQQVPTRNTQSCWVQLSDHGVRLMPCSSVNAMHTPSLQALMS